MSDEKVFVANDGSAIALLSRTPVNNGDVAYSPDGETFFALVVTGYSGSRDKDQISLENPRTGDAMQITRTGDTVTCGLQKFTAIEKTFDHSKLTGLPNVRDVEYLLKDGSGKLYFVSNSKYDYSYESLRLYIGDGEEMRQVPIKKVARYRDGGSTFLQTEEGTLYVPTSFNELLVPHWGEDAFVLGLFADKKSGFENADTVLTKLDPIHFDITEDDSGVRITRRQTVVPA